MNQTSLFCSLKIQCRVIGALLLREVITRYGRHGLGLLWLILEPMLFTLAITALWYFSRANTVSNIPIVAFAITGYSSILLWRNMANRSSKAMESNLPLMYHRNVKVIDIFLSRAILEWVGATTALALLSIFFIGINMMSPPYDIIFVIEGWLLLSWFAIALGLIVGSISSRSETFERVWPIISFLMFPISGAFFMIHWLPETAKHFILWIPMVHGVEMVRCGFFGNLTPTYGDPAYLSLVNLLMMFIGLALVRAESRRG